MAVIESLKETYYSLEDKWYDFVDGISEKVPPFGNLIDSLEDKNIPTFPLAIVLVLVLLLLVIFFITSGNNSSLTILVTDGDSNPLEGATVIALADGAEKANIQTGADGKAIMFLANGTYSIKIDKDNHASQTREVILSGNSEEDFVLSLEDATISKAVYLKTADGSLISGTGTLIYKCKGSADESVATYTNGTFDAKVSASCEEIEVLSMQNYKVVSATASFSGNSAVTVEQEVQVTGKVNVNISVEGSTSVPAGLRVKLVALDNTYPLENISTGTAIVTFDSVPVKKYYVLISSSDGNYSDYDGSKLGEVKEVTKDTLTEFNVSLRKVQKSTIIINVKDSLTSNPVSGAEVKLTLATNSNEVKTKITGVTGQAKFDVADSSNYILTVDHPDYLIGETKGATSGEVIDVLLTKVNETNNNSILVRVIDGKKNPVDNARVILKKIDPEEPVVGEKTTGATGEAEFFNLELGKSYMATVSKEGFGSVNSTNIQIVPRTQKTLEVVFDIGEGTIKVKAMDNEKNPLSGVSVKAINYYTSAQEGTSILTTTEGTASFSIRADKKIYFVIESAGYSKYFTSAFYPIANATTDKEIILVKSVAQLTASLVGVYSGTAVVSETKDDSETAGTVSQGVYTVKAILQVPKGSYSEAGIHLRTGKQEQGVTNLMEEDGLYLSEVESSGRITQGTTYSPPAGYEKDSKNLVQGNAKWANSVWKNPQEGTYEVEAEITVIEANPNAPLNLFYRGWAKGATVIRDPAMTTPASNELYSAAKNRVLLAGAGNLCSGSFCKSYTIEATEGSEAGKKKYVTGTVEAKKDTQYLLTADLTNYSGRAMTGAVLVVEGKSLDVNAISVNGSEQTDKTINLGTLGVDAPLRVQVLFSTTSSGTSGIKLSISSASKTELEDTITVNVKANKKFTLDMLPKMIIPYINNTLFFEAKDGNESMDGVLITIKSGKDVLGTVETTGEGLAKYELASPKIGDELTITAKKEGYDDVEITKKVDKALLTITPPEISETIKIGEVTAIEETILMQNNTAKDIKITSTEINGDLKNYLEAKFSGNIAGTVIEQGKDRNYTLSMKLTSNALRLQEPKDVTGTILVNTEITGTTQSFSNEIPVEIRLTMPGYMDSAKCLKVTPASLEFITSDSEQSLTVTITNSCTAEGIEIPLHNLEAKLSEESKFGTISISGKGFTNASLGNTYTKIADYFDREGEETLTVRFAPNTAIASGTQEFTISIIGKNILEDKTEEKTEAQIKTKVTMSSLSKCVEIEQPEGGILLDVAPWNMGYGALMASDYASSMSAYGQSYGGFSRQSSPYGMQGTTMAGMGMTGYGAQGYGTGYANNFNNYSGQQGTQRTMSYQQNAFTIKNTCAVDIEIDLDPDARINVSEEKFTIGKDSDSTVIVDPGYVLGKYKIVVNAKPAGTQETKKKIGEVKVTVRKLGDIDTDCIKTNVTKISLNSFIYKPQKYSVYNYCYDQGVQLSRSNVATIECSAPQSQYGASAQYFQQGAESAYSSSYPLGGQYASYQNYIQPNGCAANSCSLITGTRVRNRTVQQGNNGSIERVDFEVMPSAQYIPQRKLFNSSNGSYGLFQNLGDIRQWATETDARTNVYGNLNISYTNQYNSAECMEFPITLSDIWRLGESIDSAINWGDPNAKAKDCQNKNALDIQDYWASKGVTLGAIPDEQYNGSSYKYIAEPPALRIGAAPSAASSAYPSYDLYYYRSKQMENTSNNSSGEASKNCGLFDSITVKTPLVPAEKAGGAIIRILETGTGSLFNNTRGSNLMVEVDRSGLIANCVYVEMPVSGKVTRAVNFDSTELVWTLKVLITKQNYKPTTIEECTKVTPIAGNDCEDKLKTEITTRKLTLNSTNVEKQAAVDAVTKANPACVSFISIGTVDRLLIEAEAKGTCESGSYKEYGFDKIKYTGLEIPSSEINTYCTNNFCNSEQLQLFLYNKIQTIKDLSSAYSGVKLSELYKQVQKQTIKSCTESDLSFYKGDTGLALDNSYKLDISNTDVKNTIISKNDLALDVMVNVLNDQKDKDKLLLEVEDKTELATDLSNLGMAKVGTKWYVSVKRYIELLKTANTTEGCKLDGKSCNIVLCGSAVELKVDTFKWMSEHARIKKGVIEKTEMNKEDIEVIYAQNSGLNSIHKNATANVLLTKIDSLTEKITPTIIGNLSNIIKEYTIKFSEASKEIGNYPVTIDYVLGTDKEVTATFGEKSAVAGATKATSNILLQAGLKTDTAEEAKILDNATKAIAVEKTNEGKIVSYQRVPVLLKLTIYGNETGASYKVISDTIKVPTELVNWYVAGILKGADMLSGGSYVIPIAPSQTPQELKGILYAPQKISLAFNSAKVGGTITTQVLAIGSGTRTSALSTQTSTPIEIAAFNKGDLTLEKLINEVKEERACAVQDGIIWNEKKLLQGN